MKTKLSTIFKKSISLALLLAIACTIVSYPSFALGSEIEQAKQESIMNAVPTIADDVASNNIQLPIIIETEYFDMQKALGEVARNSNTIVQTLAIQNLDLDYNSSTNTLNISAIVMDTQSKFNIVASGKIYNREHVDYEIAYIADVDMQNQLYTFVYFEMFYQSEKSFLKFYIERNSDGEIYTATVEISNSLMSEIHKNAYNCKMTEDQYMELINLNTKSPNHAIEKGENSIEIEEEMRTISPGQSSESLMTRTNMLDEWIRLFADQKTEGTIKYTDYAVNQDVFNNMTTSLGAQWYTYSSNPSINYKVVRCAYYSLFSGTYTFYYAMIRSFFEHTGSSVTFRFGFHNTPYQYYHPDSYSYRVELNKNKQTMRYVANYGLRFETTIVMQLYSETFTQVRCEYLASEINGAADYLIGLLGLWNTTIGTAQGIYEVLLETGERIPKFNNSNLLWNIKIGDADRRYVALSIVDTGAYCYKPYDNTCIYALVEGTPTVGYSWAYIVSV